MGALILFALLQATPDAGAAAPKPAAATPPAASAAPAPPVPAAKKKPRKPKAPPPPALVLFHVNRRETLRLAPNAKFHFPDGTQSRFNRFMRCHHTNRRHAMAPRLLRLLAEISRHFAGKRVLVIAGYRAPRVARNPKSPHKQGLAVDFRVDGVPNPELRDYCRQSFQKVGIGYYPNSSFVHLDIRRGQGAFWIDYSGPGEAPLYSRTPDDDLKSGRSESFRPGHVGEGEGDSEGQEGEGPAPPKSSAPVGPRPQTPLPTGG